MTRRRSLSFTAIAFIVCGLISAQTPSASPAFEVAAVKRNPSGGNGGGTRQVHGLFTATNSTLQALIRYAWNVIDYQIQGPGWMASERYDIEAKYGVNAGNSEVRTMLQNLLTERFGMRVRHDVKQLPVYAVVLARGGSRLRSSQPAESTAVTSSNHSISVNKATLAQFATILSGQTDRPVLDATDLPGTFDIKLDWVPDATGAEGVPSGPSLFTALQDQLGLRLESRTGPVDVIVIERADKIPSEN